MFNQHSMNQIQFYLQMHDSDLSVLWLLRSWCELNISSNQQDDIDVLSYSMANTLHIAIDKDTMFISPCNRPWVLTHLPHVPHMCVNESGQHWFR